MIVMKEKIEPHSDQYLVEKNAILLIEETGVVKYMYIKTFHVHLVTTINDHVR